MRLLINASTLVKGGGVQVGDSFIRELVNHPEHQYMVACSKQIVESLGDLAVFPDFIQFKIAPPIGVKEKFLRFLRWNPFLSRLCKEFSADAVFTVFGPSYWKPPVPHLCGFAQCYHLYLDSPFYQTVSLKAKIRYYFLRTLHLYMFNRDADSLVIESSDGKERLHNIYPSKPIFVVSNTYNPVFDQKDLWDFLNLPSFSGTTLLTVSAPYPHKNLQAIKKVTKYLQKNYPDFKFRFVVTTNADFFGFSNDNYPDWLLPLGKISINQCPSLYQQADIMFLPTLMEVFSANYPEAMRMSVPIATSDLSFAHSICGDAADYFNPLSPEDIGESIYRLATDSVYRNQLIEKGKKRLKSFQNSTSRASAYLKILEEIATRNKL